MRATNEIRMMVAELTERAVNQIPDANEPGRYRGYSRACWLVSELQKVGAPFPLNLARLLPTCNRDVNLLHDAGVRFGPGQAQLEPLGREIEAKLNQEAFNRLADMGAACDWNEYTPDVATALTFSVLEPSKKRMAALRAHPFHLLAATATTPEEFDVLSDAFPEYFATLASRLSNGKKLDKLIIDFSI